VVTQQAYPRGGHHALRHHKIRHQLLGKWVNEGNRLFRWISPRIFRTSSPALLRSVSQRYSLATEASSMAGWVSCARKISEVFHIHLDTHERESRSKQGYVKELIRKNKKTMRCASLHPSTTPNTTLLVSRVSISTYHLRLPLAHRPIRLGVNVHLGGAAAMPRRQQDTAAAALVLHVLERVHDVGNAAQAAETAETGAPCTGVMLASYFLACNCWKRLTV